MLEPRRWYERRDAQLPMLARPSSENALPNLALEKTDIVEEHAT
jgi:hypothetical protein